MRRKESDNPPAPANADPQGAGPATQLDANTSQGVDLREILPGIKGPPTEDMASQQIDPAWKSAAARVEPGPTIVDFDTPEESDDIRENDVVQIVEPGSRQYGTLFIVGALMEGKVHGHYILNSKVEYVTVPEPECARIGVSKVRSRRAVSPKWASTHQNPR